MSIGGETRKTDLKGDESEYDGSFVKGRFCRCQNNAYIEAFVLFRFLKCQNVFFVY